MTRCIICDKKRPDNRKWEDRKLRLTPEQIERKKKSSIKYDKSYKGVASRLIKEYTCIDKKKGRTCDLTLEYMYHSLSKPCIYCGFYCTGLDRIDNSKGHTMDNCMPCCIECNTARMHNFTMEEMKIIGKAIKQVKESRLINSQYLLNLRL